MLFRSENYYKHFSTVWKFFEDFVVKKYLIYNLGKYNNLSDFKKIKSNALKLYEMHCLWDVKVMIMANG